MRLSRSQPLTLLALTLLVVAGCSATGPRRMRVWGSVSYQGAPINQGTITLIPMGETGGPSTGAAIAAGRYEIPQAAGPRAGGTYRVELHAVRATGATEPNPKDPGAPLAVYVPIFPAEYNTQSILQVTVADDAAQNQFDFDLPSRPAAAP